MPSSSPAERVVSGVLRRKLLKSRGGCCFALLSVWFCFTRSIFETQEEDSFYQQIGLKFEDETNKMLHLEHGFVWC